VTEPLTEGDRDGIEGEGFAVPEDVDEATAEAVATGVDVGIYDTIVMVIPVNSVSLSDVNAIVAGTATTWGEGTTDPEPVKTFPADVPIRRKSQHPSVVNPIKVTSIYPVALETVCLQFKLLT
jgi:hypothetical protein